MIQEKAAIFIDNSNIFKGILKFSKMQGKGLRFRWDKLIEMLEAQEPGLDVYSRHFFASLPASDASKVRNRPIEDQSAQVGFYKAIQEPPLNFQLHGIPLKNRQKLCRSAMIHAFNKCRDAHNGYLMCKCRIDIEECKACTVKYQESYEKGVDVALATQLIISCSMNSTVPHRIILVSGDGDYIEAVRHARQVLGKNVQIVSWKFAFSRELEKVANKPTLYIEDHWETLCEEKKGKQQTVEFETEVIEDLDVLELPT